ncbi:MAG TPA: energy transducer TonB [Longimicrobium sp.]|jgi:TonB family protein|nr:energy transducer TonB [Longimicrobium sp.]
MRVVALVVALTAAAPLAAQQSAPDSARVYHLREVEVLPRPQNVAEFAAVLQHAYPPHLRAAGVGGTVQVAFVVDTAGQPRDVRVVSTSDSSFSAPTAQAVSLLRFSPAQVQGRPVAVRVEQPIVWVTEASAPVGAADSAPQATASAAAPDTLGAYEVAAVTEPPRARNTGAIASAMQRLYPRALRHAGRRGEVVVRFIVEPDGSTSHARIVRSDEPGFEAPTLEVVRTMRFHPGRLGGAPVRVWVLLPIQWSAM